MPQAWRITKSRLADRAYDGEGARRIGGRWNSKGVAMVYASASASLALLEVLVHVEDESLLPAYTLISAELDEDLIHRLDEAALPPDWRSSPAPPELREIGDAWAASRRSVVLAVPSVVVPWETNLLLNPSHPRFAELRIDAPRRFELDQRLRRRGST
ncbi:MAG TPA: RES domain-containing protein [Thermoanaerobaculia bacterium]|nr:RES domain-containing protein [Thermoanaerobaculia bacterium]